MTPSSADRDLLERVHDELGDRRAGSSVIRTTLGERLVAVELAADGDTAMGIAHCPLERPVAAIPSNAHDLSRWAFEPPRDDPVAAALGIAALNARSAGVIPWRVGDPMAALESDVDLVATVGLFRPAFRKFDAVDVRVIEREPLTDVATPSGVTVSVYGPEEAPAAIEGVDVLFVTGSSLIYGGTLGYLQAAAAVPTVVLIGATASFLPEPAFDAGVTVVAGARVTDPDRVRAGIEAGQCGTDLHDDGLVKVYVSDVEGPSGLTLGAGDGNTE